MGMFGFFKKKKLDAVPSPPKMPDLPAREPSFDMPDLKFDFQPGGMDAPPLPNEIQQPSFPQPGYPPMQPGLSQPAAGSAPGPSPPDQFSWNFDAQPPQEKYPLPPGAKPAAMKDYGDKMPPIKPLKFDDFSMGKKIDTYDEQSEPQLEEPELAQPEVQDEGTEPPGVIPEETPLKRQPEQPESQEFNFDLDESDFDFTGEEKPELVKRGAPPVIEPKYIVPAPRQIVRRVIDRDLFISVDDFREIANMVGSLGDETKMSEEGLLRIKDVTLGKEKVYDKWQNDLEQIEKELIQLDKVLFKM